MLTKKTKTNLRWMTVCAILLIATLLAACGAPAAAPTATTIPPTDTPAPPTATPISPTATPMPVPIPERILFIGDSLTWYNEGLEKHVKGLAASCDPSLQIETARVVISGAPLRVLWNSSEAPDTIREGEWDVVVLQEDLSMKGYSEEAFHEYVRNFDEEIKGKGARTVLYMAQDYESDYYKTTVAEIARAYSAVGSELGVDVAPVALAWESALRTRPDLRLYDWDGFHPNLLGTYLTTNVLYNTIFKQSSEGCIYLPADLFGEGTPTPDEEDWEISQEEADFLQGVALETVSEYE